MLNTILYTRQRMGAFLMVASLATIPTLAQKQSPNAPLFKSIRTTIHRAVQKDTAWTPGAIVDQIHYVRYDRNGRKIAENSLNPDGSAASKIVYVYNKNGWVKEEIFASIKKGGVNQIFQYHYDSLGRIDGRKRLSAQRVELGIDTIIRNEAGLVIQKIHAGTIIRPNNQQTLYREALDIAYNDRGEVTEVSESSTLNKNGNSGKRKLNKRDTIPFSLQSSSSFERFEAPKNKRVDISYDAYNNWIKRTEYNGAMPEFIVMRDIEYAGEEDNDWKKLSLEGKVKSVHQTSYIALPNGPDIINRGEKKGTFFIYQFDKNGRKVMETHFSDAGVPKGNTEYKYNAKGDIEKEIRKSPAGTLEHSILWIYDDENRLRNKSLLDAKGELVRKSVFRNDGEGNCIAEIWMNRDGSKHTDIRFQYDPYGNLIYREVLTAPTASTAPSESTETANEPISRIWNARGRLIEEKIGASGNERQYTYQYSTRGEVISGTESIQNGPAIKFVYKFYNDKFGNWKKRIKFIDNKPVLYEERVYTYYE